MPKGPLPGYIWDERMRGGRYRHVLPDGRLGRLVGRDEIVAGLRTIARRAEIALGDIADAVRVGSLTQADGALAGMYYLKDLYNAYSALARGGWSGMDAAAWGRNGRILGLGTADYPVGEYTSWRNFMAEIARGQLTEGQVRMRAGLYAGKAYSRYWAEDLLLKLQGGEFAWEQWLAMDDERTCDDCVALDALGIVPIGTITTTPGAGATICLGNCRCSKVYFPLEVS